jgi:hypothetical protein
MRKKKKENGKSIWGEIGCCALLIIHFFGA